MSANKKERFLPPRVYCGAGVFAAALALTHTVTLDWRAALAAFGAAWALAGGDVLWRALKRILRGRVFDENFLMAIASIGAFCIGEYPEAAAVMLFYQLGEAFQERALRKSRRSIASLLSIRPDAAHLKRGDVFVTVSPDAVRPGDFILIKPGERVPLDGLVTSGASSLDASALTGESMPRDVGPGAEVLSGAVNLNGALLVRVTREAGESTAAKILRLVEEAAQKKARVENFITVFARYYTPAVVLAALALALVPPFVTGAAFSLWFRRAIIFLVVSCPCALVISVPLSFFAGIGAASRRGILVKGSAFIEALARADTVVFDKTGTLSKGVFKVKEVLPASGWPREEVLFFAAHAEAFSTHPIALSVREAWDGGIDTALVEGHEERPGRGIKVRVRGREVLAGNRALMAEEAVPCEALEAAGSVLYLAVDGAAAGALIIADELKDDSADAVRALKALGIKMIALLTGDSRQAGEAAARELGIDRVYTGLLPQDKVAAFEEIAQGKRGAGTTVFAGDGVNDAPVLARSDVGVAMGGLGSDAAIEAADLVLMTDEPSRLALALRIARKTSGIVRQNIAFALGCKAIILALGALGLSGIWAAVFGDVGVTCIAVLNALRAMRVREGG
ncbi:MAG: cadmium-translocating P-type ATPase [Treponema sp.]|jgi:Cd2+/Zn2+-exporting ATPase|nr:cadmium-translocating P-type ATPase [Treponema sp.]